MREVLNPYGRALSDGVDLNSLLKSDPIAGGTALDALCEETRAELSNGPTVYRLVGASPEHCTPMQYGGYYLERDRELLASAPGPVEVVVEGEAPYMDFVSDLPCSTISAAQPTGDVVHA